MPERKDIAEAINTAMRLIEAEYPDLAGILPKNYQDFEADLLRKLVRMFNKDAVKKATGDIVGRIYEYFQVSTATNDLHHIHCGELVWMTVPVDEYP